MQETPATGVADADARRYGCGIAVAPFLVAVRVERSERVCFISRYHVDISADNWLCRWRREAADLASAHDTDEECVPATIPSTTAGRHAPRHHGMWPLRLEEALGGL